MVTFDWLEWARCQAMVGNVLKVVELLRTPGDERVLGRCVGPARKVLLTGTSEHKAAETRAAGWPDHPSR